MDEGIAKFIEKTCGFPELVPQLGKTRRTISKMSTHTHNGIHKGGPAAEGGRPTFVEAAEGRLHYIGDGEAANIAKTPAYTY